MLSRLSATCIKWDSTTLTSDEDQSVFNLIHANTKRGDTEHGRQVSVIVLSNRNKGSAVFARLIDIYERNNVHYLKTLKRKLSGMKLQSFRTTGRRSHDLYNVEDFYNSIDIDIIKYTEAGDTWSEDQKLRMIGDAFDGCELHMGHMCHIYSRIHQIKITCSNVTNLQVNEYSGQ